MTLPARRAAPSLSSAGWGGEEGKWREDKSLLFFVKKKQKNFIR
jgi:hypothetical protein